MFKWIEQIQNVKTDLMHLASAKNAKDLEHRIEGFLEKLSTNPNLLNSLSLALNTQSQIKSFLNFGFEKLWKNIQLPNKKDQERTLYLLHEMQYKIHQLEKELLRVRRPYFSEITPIRGHGTETKPISVVEKRNAKTPLTKMV